MPSNSVLTDKHPGALSELTSLGNHSNTGGGGSTPTLVPPVLHVCTIEGTQYGAPDFSDVPAQEGEEVTEAGC